MIERRLPPTSEARDAPGVDMHANQLVVSLETVRELVDEQFPAWRHLRVRGIASQGTVNAIFRIGDQFAARFPIEPRDVGTTRRWLASEAEADRALAGRTRFPTPVPVALGDPGLAIRPRMGAWQGVGVRAGDGTGLVLHRE